MLQIGSYYLLGTNIKSSILSAWDNIKSSKPTHVWMFHKDQMVRGKKFFRRETFIIKNIPENLRELEKYEVTDRLDRLKEICNCKVE